MSYNFKDLNKWKYTESDDVLKAKQDKTNAEKAVANYGTFQYVRQQDLDKAINAQLNQGKFSYDLNGDALYQQYKENYINQGKQAMMDTMGQAAAMTGGYGNSYAATVGNQTYQGYLQNLNNMIPQLQQMALDRYNAEADRLKENVSLLRDDRADALNEHELGYNKLVDRRDYASSNYNNISNLDLEKYTNKFNSDNDAIKYLNETGYTNHRDGIEDARYEEEQRKKDEQQRFDNELALKSYNYQVEQDDKANARADAQLKLSQNAQKIAELQAGVVRDEKTGEIIGITQPEEEFSRYTYAGINEENGKRIFYKDGEKYEFDEGINPYGAGSNKDAVNGTFSNGYQPDNIDGQKLTWSKENDVGEWSDDINGVKQKVWKTPDGQKWLWDGTIGRYVRHNG